MKDVLLQVVDRLAQDRLMADVLSGAQGFDGAEHELTLERVFVLGREQDCFREDASALDVHILLAGVAAGLLGREISDPVVWHRYVHLILAALRPTTEEG
ncbi:hypothetical protein ACFYO7_31005 [Nocardia salmonicida]|uniref:hypothetical protein n=1 Tax=Nocardia salmonicida TaxID=53431 RepID=UPI00368E52ED